MKVVSRGFLPERTAQNDSITLLIAPLTTLNFLNFVLVQVVYYDNLCRIFATESLCLCPDFFPMPPKNLKQLTKEERAELFKKKKEKERQREKKGAENSSNCFGFPPETALYHFIALSLIFENKSYAAQLHGNLLSRITPRHWPCLVSSPPRLHGTRTSKNQDISVVLLPSLSLCVKPSRGPQFFLGTISLPCLFIRF